MRTNLNIAVVPMTSHPAIKSSNGSETANKHYGCPVKPSPSTRTVSNDATLAKDAAPSQKHYDWDQVTQGKILGSFFYSYFIFMIPGGRIAETFGSRWIIFSTLAVPAIASIIVPFVTDYHYSILMLCRFLLGMFQASFFPSAYGMVCTWFPQQERSFAFAVVDIGAALGSVMTYTAAGIITNHWGWPYLFYIPGVYAFIMSFLFVIGTRNQPNQHPLITECEIKLIQNESITSSSRGGMEIKSPSPPWRQILTTPSVLATMLMKFAAMTCFSFIYLELPKYLSEMIHENISDNGSINAVINIICLIAMIGCSALSERIIQKGWLGRTATRKLFSVFVGFGCAACFILIPIFGCSTYALYGLLCMSTFFGGCYTGSDGPIVSEMTNHFPATLYAFFNMIAMSTGFIVPAFVGFVLDSYDDPTAGWPIIFYSCAAAIVIATISFLIFAKAERQEFDLKYDKDFMSTQTKESLDRRVSLCLMP